MVDDNNANICPLRTVAICQNSAMEMQNDYMYIFIKQIFQNRKFGFAKSP